MSLIRYKLKSFEHQNYVVLIRFAQFGSNLRTANKEMHGRVTALNNI